MTSAEIHRYLDTINPFLLLFMRVLLNSANTFHLKAPQIGQHRNKQVYHPQRIGPYAFLNRPESHWDIVPVTQKGAYMTGHHVSGSSSTGDKFAGVQDQIRKLRGAATNAYHSLAAIRSQL